MKKSDVAYLSGFSIAIGLTLLLVGFSLIQQGHRLTDLLKDQTFIGTGIDQPGLLIGFGMLLSTTGLVILAVVFALLAHRRRRRCLTSKRTKLAIVLLTLSLLTSTFTFTGVTYADPSGDRWYGIADPDLSFVRASGDSITGIKAYTTIFEDNVRNGFSAYYIGVILQDFVGEWYPEWIALGWLNYDTDETLFYVDWKIDQEYGITWLDPAVDGSEHLLTIKMPYPAGERGGGYTWNAYIDGVEVASLESERGWAVTLRGESYDYRNRMEGHFWGLSYRSADGLATESVGTWHSWSEVRVNTYSAWYDSYKGKMVHLSNCDDFAAPYYAYPRSATNIRLLDRSGMARICNREYMSPRKSKPFRPGVLLTILLDAFEEIWV